MGFLIFALRKLMLRREINRKQSRLVCLVHDIQRMKSQMSIMQQTMADAKNATNMMIQNTASIFDNVNAAKYQSNGLAAQKATQEYFEAKNGGTTGVKLDELESKMETEAAKAAAESKSMIMKAMAKNQAFNGLTYAMNNVFDQVDKSQLQIIASKETSLEMEKESLESSLAVDEADYKSVKEAEQAAAKNIAANLGGNV